MNLISLRPSKLPQLGTPPAACATEPAPGRVPREGTRLSVLPSGIPACRPRASRRRRLPAPAAEERTDAAESPSARELLDCYAPLVRQIAGGFQRKLPRNVLRDDLVAAGMSGLWDAILKHGDQPDGGFEWYVRVRIRGAILDELRAQDWLPRRVRAKTAGEGAPLSVVRIEDVSSFEQARCMTASDTVSAEAAVERNSDRRALEAAIGKLPERERHIVSKHYFDGVKFKELGAELGVSEPRISQLHSRAMQRLRGLMDRAA